jgi:hypothetical protein
MGGEQPNLRIHGRFIADRCQMVAGVRVVFLFAAAVFRGQCSRMKGDGLLAIGRHQRSMQRCYHLRPLADRSSNSVDGTGSDVAYGEDALATGF